MADNDFNLSLWDYFYDKDYVKRFLKRKDYNYIFISFVIQGMDHVHVIHLNGYEDDINKDIFFDLFIDNNLEGIGKVFHYSIYLNVNNIFGNDFYNIKEGIEENFVMIGKVNKILWVGFLSKKGGRYYNIYI